MTQVEQEMSVNASDAREAAEWMRKHGLTLVAVLGVCAQLWLRAGLLAHSYFRQDDYQMLGRASRATFTWQYLTVPTDGHLGPGALALVWVIAKVSRYSWILVSAVNLVLLACASMALLRLLKTLFGSRPAILIPFAVYLFTPLALPGFVWWTASVGWLPLSLAMFLAIDAHVRYVRTGRRRLAAAAAGWLAIGMLFAIQGMLVPLLIFALTAAYLIPAGSWPSCAMEAARKHWKVWLGYALPLVAVAGVQLASPGLRPDRSAPVGQALSFAGTLVKVGFIPGLLGGPWRWQPVGDYALALTGPVASVLSGVAAAVIVALSLWYRRHAVRAWLILASWVLIGDILPVVVGRSGLTTVSILGSDVRFLADAVPVLAICLGLAFLPIVTETGVYRARLPARWLLKAVTVLAASAFLAGSLVSSHSYQADTSGESARSYIATAREAVLRVRPGAVIVDAPVRPDVMTPAFFGRASFASNVLRPLLPNGARLRWTQAPTGLVANLMVFDNLGRLWPAAVAGAVSLPAPGRRGCWQVGGRVARIPLNARLYRWSWVAQLWYAGPATTLAVWFGGQWENVTLPAGRHDAYVPAAGSGSSIFIQAPAASAGACLSQVVVGTLQPSPFGQPVPAVPAP